MADTKISAMTVASSLTGTELIPIVQSGTNKSVTTAVVQSYVGLPTLGTAIQQLRVNAGGTALEYFTPTTNPFTTTGDLLVSGDNSGIPARLPDVAIGSYLRSGGTGTLPLWSTLTLPNAATSTRLVYATGTNIYGESASLTFNGTTLTLPAITFSNTSINTTAGDAATINASAGRFRKDTSGSTFTLTNSFITTNSIITLTAASDISITGNVFSVVAGSGSAIITFWTAGIGAAAPTANQDVNFTVIN